MASRKQVVMMALSLVIGAHLQTTHAADASVEEHSSKITFNSATDAMANAFGEVLSPIRKLWGQVIKTFSPHYPILNDVKETAGEIGKGVSKLAQETTVIAEEFIDKARDKAHEMSDYALEKAEETTQRICDDASKKITESSTKALELTQKTIEDSVQRATHAATQQVQEAHQEILASTEKSVRIMANECGKVIEESVDSATKQSCAHITATSEAVMAMINTELTQSAANMGQEFEKSAERIADTTAKQLSKETEKSITFAAKASTLVAAGSISLIVATLASNNYMQSEQLKDLGFVAAGLAGAAASYKAIDNLSTEQN